MIKLTKKERESYLPKYLSGLDKLIYYYTNDCIPKGKLPSEYCPLCATAIEIKDKYRPLESRCITCPWVVFRDVVCYNGNCDYGSKKDIYRLKRWKLAIQNRISKGGLV